MDTTSLLWIGALLSLQQLHQSGNCLRLTNMSAPVIADRRQDMQLDCHFDMGAEILYAVKWYKDDQEFFRFMPHQQPHKITYPVAGVHMSPGVSACGDSRCNVRLTNLTREHSGGAYRCEVSSEAPAFRLASETHNVTVAALPLENPQMNGLQSSYALEDTLALECTSGAGDPTPVLTWFINDQPVSATSLGESFSTPSDSDVGLASRTQPLRLRIERKHLQGSSALRIRCDSTQPAIPSAPQSVTRTIIVRIKPPQVNNEKYHGSAPSASTNVQQPLMVLLLTTLLVLNFV